ncbi:phage/plasmid primase, P4 family [Chloroflexota bacterium]
MINDNPADYIQRLLAGCPVKEPDPAEAPNNIGDPDYNDVLAALYEAYQEGGQRVANRAWAAVCNVDPAMRDLLPSAENFYPQPIIPTPELFARLDRYETNESGQGEAFSDLFYHRLRYLPGVGWFIWTGYRWQPDEREAIVQYAIMAARTRKAAVQARKVETDEQEKARKKAVGFAENAANYRTIRNSIIIGKTVPDLIISHKEFDRQSHLLGVKNGVVDLTTGQHLEARQDQYISHSTNVPYFPDAQAPRWEQFISEIFGGKADLIAYIQRAIGYSLTGDISEHCFFLCYGIGANGKSTLLNILGEVAGDYAANTAFNTLEHGRQSSTGQELVQLRGRRVVLSSETNDGSRLNEARIKAITGGDKITGRYLYARTGISFVPTFKIWLATNHKPTIKGNDEGIWRRVRLIPFLESFTKDNCDRHLEAKLRQELPGILAWAVRGAMAWYRQGLGEPQDVVDATSAYRDESDTFGLFLSENTIQHEIASVQSGTLYTAYQRWTEANGLGTLSSVKFARAMETRGFEKKRTSAYKIWQGIGLLADD